MYQYDLKNLLNIIEIFSPFAIYLALLILIRIVLEKLTFLKNPPFENTFIFTKNILHIFILIITLIIAIGMLGIDVQGIITGLGLVSFALGFALKDVISNFLSGFSVLLYGPFKVGDFITIDDIHGKVSKIDLRYTILETEEEECYIPNNYLTGTKISIKKYRGIPREKPP
jgi:small conductance mechanosensitive channel